MKKSFLVSLLVVATFGCSNGPDDGLGGGGSGAVDFLQVGNTNQEDVVYSSDISEISFAQSQQVGDSTFYQANLDLDGNLSADLLFQLVTWTDNILLTVKPVNGFSVSGDDSDYEIFGTERSFEGLKLFPDGTIINGSIIIDATDEDLFVSQFRNGVLTATSLLIWNDIAYLPFKSALIEGWVGLTIDANGTDIQGINISTIATRD
ncbi:hypothetical protein [Roseivirga sp. E12]|uniref:hypothetical protein n=1 Tax=Roseivirga sp. E12 TaxID=2819237 RepID=UPI001ABD3AE6|nr:hypothetical protein [Roseivirga sp. E12]MBO3700681.1 hypothetical protein [Roseivirga sp. E12]